MIVYVGSKNLYRSSNIVNQLYNEYDGCIPFMLDSNNIENYKTYIYCLTLNDIAIYDFRNQTGYFDYIDMVQNILNKSNKVYYGLLCRLPKLNLRKDIDLNKFVYNLENGIVKDTEIFKSLILSIEEMYKNEQKFWSLDFWSFSLRDKNLKHLSQKQLLRYRKLFLIRIIKVIEKINKRELLLYFVPISSMCKQENKGYICTTNPNYVKFVDVEKRR